MDKKYNNLINEMFSEHYRYLEKIVRRQLQIPGVHISFDGKDLKDILASNDLSSFMWEESAKGQLHHDWMYNKPSFPDKEQLLNNYNGYSNDVDEYFLYNITIIHQIIISTVDLIPSELNDEEKSIAQYCLDFSNILSSTLITHKNLIHRILMDDDAKNKELNDSTILRILKVQKGNLVQGFNELSYLILSATWFRQLIYEYYYGPKENQANSASIIMNFFALFESKLSNIEKNTEQTAKTTEQAFTEKKTANESLKKIKENQEEIKELVINRNEIDAEKTGTLSVEECVFIIGVIEKKYVELKQRDCIFVGIPPETVKKKTEGTIRRNIEFWDQYQNGNKAKGRKPPRKDYSRNMDKETFGKWYNEIMLNKYNKWRAANHIDTLSGRPVKRFGDKYK